MVVCYMLRPAVRCGGVQTAKSFGRPIGGAKAAGIRRSFSTAPRWLIQVSEMSESDISSLKVDQERLMSTLHHTCQWGTGVSWGDGPTETGMSRLALTDADKQVRDWFVSTTKELGCKVTVDSMGNIFAVRPGLNNDVPPIFIGSHLDTQPAGGRYDGILGVLAGVEALKVLNDNWVETQHPVGVVNWTNEEGARFPGSMLASSVWGGAIPIKEAHGLQEVGGGSSTVRSELQRIGYLGTVKTTHKSTPMSAHFELHIEQGPILEAEGKKIGVVQGVQARKWLTVEVTGKAAHTGATPLELRADALLAASKMIVHGHKLATKHKAYVSTGMLTLEPGSTNTVPSLVRFSVDIRAPKDATVDTVFKELSCSFEAIAKGDSAAEMHEGCTVGVPCGIKIKEDNASEATEFHTDCIDAVRESAKAVLGSDAENLMKDVSSGAAHDSVYTSKHCPTSMIFVPSKDGVSHNPAEYTSPEECTIGAQVLLGAVLRFDKSKSANAGGN